MRRTWTLQQHSVVPAEASAVWGRVVTPEGINDEMRPWLTMSLLSGAGVESIDDVVPGRPIGRAWVRLFGVLPVDADHLMVALVEPGRRFREESTMFSMRAWIHDRLVEPDGDGRARVTDVVSFTPRLALRPLGPVLLRVLRTFFAHRHRRLARYFG